jgi:hypothetical protein
MIDGDETLASLLDKAAELTDEQLDEWAAYNFDL